MSKAFTKESEAGDLYDDLPDRPISANNLVTPNGLKLIEAEIADLRRAHTKAQADDDRATLARINRDLRYWAARRAKAQVIPPPANVSEIRFGSRVTITRDDGREQTFAIVGEDEANPSQGTLSYVSPVAQALLGKHVGDVIQAGTGEAEIIKIA